MLRLTKFDTAAWWNGGRWCVSQGVKSFGRLGRALRARDPEESGQLSVAEFDAALREAGIVLTDDEERYIIRKFCVAGGVIPLDLFSEVVAREVKPQPKSRAPDRLVTARAVSRLFSEKMFCRFRTVKRAFRIFDEDPTINNPKQFHDALQPRLPM